MYGALAVNVVVIALASLMTVMGGIFPNLLSAAAKEMIEKNYGKMEHLAVYIESIPSVNIFYGKVDRIRILASGFKIGDFIISDMEIISTPVSFNPTEVLSSGKFRVENPILAEGRITLTEEDLNRYLNSPNVLKDLSHIRTDLSLFPGSSSQVQYLSITRPHIYLHPQGLVFTFDLSSGGEGEAPLPIIFKANLAFLDSKKLGLTSMEISTEGLVLPRELAAEVEKALNPILDLDRYSSPDVRFTFQGLEMYEQKFVILAQSQIQKIN